MSAGGYDGPHMPSAFSRHEPRRPSGNIPASYDRTSNAAPRRRTPSPGPSRRPYDSYVPPRSDVPFRDGMPNVYRPNNYRPDYSSSYHSRSPSPDPYSAPPRSSEPEAWDRGNSWRPPPSPVDRPKAWPERNFIPNPFLNRDDRSSRTFEPSDSWKQTHIPIRVDHSPPSDRHFDRRGRGRVDGSPDRPMRNDRAPAFIPGGDRYRPIPSKRDTHPTGRSDYDSYRPQYDNGWTPPFRREPNSPSGSHHRRDSGSFTHARTSSRHDSPHTSRGVSRKGSPSPRSVISPLHTPSRTIPDSETWTYPAVVKPDISTRPLSRSSIASTHVSDRKSPAALPLTEPSSDSQQSLPTTKVTEILLTSPAVTQEEPAKKANGPITESKKVTNGTLDQTAVKSGVETKAAPEIVTSVGKKPTTAFPITSVSNAIKQNSSIINTPSKPASEAPTTTDKAKSVASIVMAVNGALGLIPTAPVAPTLISPNSPSPPIVAQTLPESNVVTEIKQPLPSYIPTPVMSPDDEDMGINIPPTTHSPIVESIPPDTPIIEAMSPVVLPSALPTLEEIPPFSDAKSKADALRIVVMTRLLCDRQTREERVNPVLLANQSISAPLEVHPTATPDILLDKMFSGQELQDRIDSFVKTRPLLAAYMEQRHGIIDEKVARLRQEYLSLQERWRAHCNALNEQQKTLASEHEMHHTGRTTRRSTAITDAVRSDFEMEQIIASLGVDDATDPNHLSMRNVAKIPDMISVINGQVDYVLDDTAHFIENPSQYYAPHTGIHDWTDEEKKIFIDKFAAHPKQFGIIADYIPNKTAAQCVDYYYLHKNRFIDFRKVVSQFAPNKRKRRGMGKKKGNGLLVDIALHDMEVHRGSPTNAGSVSAPVVARAPRGRKARRNAVQFEDTPTSTPTPEPESTRPRRRKTATPSTMATSSAATPAVASTPAATSAPTSAAPTPSISTPPVVESTPASVHQDETPEQESEPRPAKRVKRTRKIKSAATVSDEPPSPGPELDKVLPATTNDGGESTARSKKDKVVPSVNQWSEDDKSLFISLLAQHGDNFKRIAASMPNKTTIQVSNYYWSNMNPLGLDNIAASAPKRSPTPDLHAAWKELPYPGSGALMTPSTPNIVSLTASRDPTPPPMSSLSFDSTRSRPPTSSSSFSSHGTPVRDSGRHTFGDSVPPHSVPPSIPRPQYHHEQSRTHHQLPPQPLVPRLGNNLPPDNRRPSLYSSSSPPRNAQYPFPNPPEHRGGYFPSKHSDGGSGRPYGLSSPQTQSRPYFAPMYPSPPAPLNGRPGYIPAIPVSGPNATPIIHSPTGMSPPKLPMQNLHGYPPQYGDSPHHTSYYPSTVSPTDSRSNSSWGPHRFYNPDGTTSYINRRRASGSSDGKGGIRRENPYPVFSNPPSSASSSRPPPGPVSYSSPPSVSPGSTRAIQRYPGWS
ncbi:hypothetical protein BDZ97DRAFT_1834066 [Flammula alnicola]|nr:hypothetical protein BDZ97DRAFT_1834066 [Flammula alnicola]